MSAPDGLALISAMQAAFETKVITAAEIQKRIKEFIVSANDEVKDIQISKTSGFITD